MATDTNASPKLDLKKSLSGIYKPRGTECILVTPPPLQVVAVEGVGNPNTAQSWIDAVGALYSVAYTLKFMLKALGNTPEFAMMPLEALWWAPDGEEFRTDDKSNWLWRAFIVLPDFVTQEQVDEALAIAKNKKDLAGLQSVVFSEFDEGPSAQVLHIGPYAEEAPTITRLHAFIEAQGLALSGKHHEIYLSDPGRTAPEKLKTVIRRPVKQRTASA